MTPGVSKVAPAPPQPERPYPPCRKEGCAPRCMAPQSEGTKAILRLSRSKMTW